jgi:hypothetical protein
MAKLDIKCRHEYFELRSTRSFPTLAFRLALIEDKDFIQLNTDFAACASID